ncbi:hypothetical protein [Streptomyces sp. MJM8645]|uniref:hypothetical protein n=1 Tax=Streptomycetaceae TaxID=2062 RepID=UPI0007AFBCEA|nr:hypothetical protein [Streptomyces sp. MJM8645]
MNPHNRLTHPGAHLVYEHLGASATNAWELSAGYPDSDPLRHLAVMVASSAREVDQLHQALTAHAQTVIERLEPIARGDHANMRGINGIIQSAGPQVELLTARRGAAYAQLTNVLSAYERCTGTDRPTTAPRRRHDSAHTSVTAAPSYGQTPQSTAAWDDEQGFARTALQAMEHGDLWLRENVHSDKYVIWGSGLDAPVEAETVERLIDAGLVSADTSTSASRMGHMLSLTPEGAAANAAARTERLRRVAALYRGITPTTEGPAPAAPSAAAARPSLSSRTR